MSAEPLEPGIDPEATAAVPSGSAEEETRDRPASQSLLDGPGTCIGPYRLILKLGEGGMGTVYMAEQEAPVRRKVALKIIRPEMDTDQVIARFKAERQALALMDHQNIARVLDVGSTSTGRPYFVMDLVKGVPITEYCDRNHLSARDRLELFVPVCQAIQHAHQKGIIHRDVKPSNVLVTLYDGNPAPKVIDFGVAKATDQRLTEKTMFTQFGQIVGTLEYMSPEQSEMGALDIDTRSDIYSLGVLLYELLTGTTPLNRAKLKVTAFTEILRKIRDEDPPKPSTRLGESEETLATISAQRKTEPARLTKLLRGELDWIVMKALEKDRTRRYETASALARDIQRYLAGDPVEAGPPSPSYRLRKFARKHRTLLATAAAFAALLVVAAAVSTSLAIHANRAETKARRQAADADRARDAEMRQRQTAESERSRALQAERAARDEEAKTKKSESETRAVLEFFQNKVLAAARPRDQEGGLGVEATIRKAVDAAEPNIASAFRDQPGAEASIRNTLGETYYYLNEPALAIAQFNRALELRRQFAGPDHPDTLAAEGNLGMAYLNAGRLAQALPLLEANLKHLRAQSGPIQTNTLVSINNLANAYRTAGRLGEALPLFAEALKGLELEFGPDHAYTLGAMNNLAQTYRDADRLEGAIPLFEETVKRTKTKLGPDHPYTLGSMNNLGLAYLDTGRYEPARELFEEALKHSKTALGADNSDTLWTMGNLAGAYAKVERLSEAIKLSEEALRLTKAKQGPDHPDTLRAMGNLAENYEVAGRRSDALALYEGALQGLTAKLGRNHVQTLAAMNNLASAHLRAGNPVAAEPLLREELALRNTETQDRLRSFEARALLGASLLSQRKFAEAEPLLLEGYNGMKARDAKSLVPLQNRLAEAGARIIMLYDAWGKKDKADEWRKRLASAADATKPKP
jgi:serine/threonine protein kinase/Tfp pilus assembly protein PilF